MNISVDNSDTKVTFSFSPKEYFLVQNSDPSWEAKYSLNYRIDRSYKGKDDDLGMHVILLTEEQAEICRKAGFTEIIL